MKTNKNIKEFTYYVEGMHCASCEVLIERKLLEIKKIKSVEASTSRQQVLIEYEGERPTLGELNEIFVKEGYVFYDQPEKKNGKKSRVFSRRDFLIILSTSLLVIIGFLTLNRLGLASWLNVNPFSSLPMFFVFGLLAGISSCAALVGGLVLSMSKQWGDLYSKSNSLGKKLQPHLMFNFGRIISYAVFGALLGAVGSKLQISPTFTSVLVMIVSVIMILLALQMIGFRAFRKFQLTTPKFITRYVANESNFKGRFMPLLMGALTFFLPCGFTITAQGLALLSGDPIKGSLMMFLFALGTLPTLLIIGFSSIEFSQKPHQSALFLKIAGILVLFFALFNINSRLNVLGFASFNDLSLQKSGISEEGFPPVVNGKQILKMEAFASGYQPNYFKVKAGILVRWEITDRGTSGCTNAIISKSLFEGQIDLKPGEVSIKEFTPSTPGKYKFSCWMGMISGVIEVVDESGLSNSSTTTLNENSSLTVPSGSSTCSCGRGVNK